MGPVGDIDAALGELGLEATAEPSALRRAYLRAVKAHPPERDPEGFRRARSAYEFLTVILPLVRPRPEGQAPGGASGDARPRAEGPAEVPLDGAAPPPPGEPATEEPRVVAVASDPAATALAAFAARIGAVYREVGEPGEAGEPPEAAVRIAREAVAAFPTRCEAHMLLVDALDAADREDEAVAAMLAAHRAGVGGFLPSLLWRAPAELTAQEVRGAPHDPATDTCAARAWLARGMPGNAAKRLRRVLDDDDASASERAGPTTAAVATLVRQILFGLLARGKRKSADELAAQAAAWLDWLAPGERPPADVLGGWLLAHELVELARAVPDEVSAAMAGALGAGDLELARADLRQFRRRSADDAASALEELRERAPNLAPLFGEMLAPSPWPSASAPAPRSVPPPKQRKASAVLWVWMAVMCLFALGRMATCLKSEPALLPAARPSIPRALPTVTAWPPPSSGPPLGELWPRISSSTGPGADPGRGAQKGNPPP